MGDFKTARKRIMDQDNLSVLSKNGVGKSLADSGNKDQKVYFEWNESDGSTIVVFTAGR